VQQKTTSSSKSQLRNTSPLDPSLHLAVDPRWPPNAPGRNTGTVRPGCLPGEMFLTMENINNQKRVIYLW